MKPLKEAQQPGVSVDGDLLRHMIEAVEDYAIYMLDLDGNIVTWSNGAERAKGYKASEIIGRNYAVFFPAESVARGLPQKALREARKHGRFREEAWRVRKDGSLFWAEVVLTTVRDDDGIMVGFAKVTRDLTERRAREDALRQAKAEAEEASRVKSDFLSNMSHELRTPLNAIIGFSEVLQSELFGPLGSDRYREYVSHIHRSGDHLLGLINDVLDLARLDADKLVLDVTDLDVVDIAHDCLQMIEPQAQKAGVVLALEGEESLRLHGDARRLRQIFLNLLSNAVKFTPQGGNAALCITQDGAMAVMAVTDTGIGMTADEIPRALSRFGQVENGLTRRYQGTGLGLPLVKQLVELQGGTLSIASTPGVGTCVTARLPF